MNGRIKRRTLTDRHRGGEMDRRLREKYMNKMKTCSKCGASNTKQSDQCFKCGAELDE